MYDLVIIDGDNIAYKNYYANIKLSFNGHLTGALFGFLRSYLYLSDKFETRNLFTTWSQSNLLRREIYPEYKAKRKKEEMEEYYRQREIIETVLKCLGCIQVKFKNKEADDAIYSIIQSMNSEEKAIIISEDKDLLQLLSDNVHQFKREKIYTPEIFEEEYGFSHLYLPFYLAVVGDKSDNIEGVTRVGPKTITPFIQKYGVNIEEASKDNEFLKLTEKLKSFKEVINRNIRLIKLENFQPNKPIDNMLIENKDKDKLLEILSSNGLASLVKPIMELYDEIEY